MRRLKPEFTVDVFERSDAKSAELADFLYVYVQNFSPTHRTDTNELIDFLENPPGDRQIVYFGLRFKGKACGFATLMIYAEPPFGIVDHLVIAPTHRGSSAFFDFCGLI